MQKFRWNECFFYRFYADFSLKLGELSDTKELSLQLASL